jgi:hypothetical protein
MRSLLLFYAQVAGAVAVILAATIIVAKLAGIVLGACHP